jgi:hypothetical protein
VNHPVTLENQESSWGAAAVAGRGAGGAAGACAAFAGVLGGGGAATTVAGCGTAGVVAALAAGWGRRLRCGRRRGCGGRCGINLWRLRGDDRDQVRLLRASVHRGHTGLRAGLCCRHRVFVLGRERFQPFLDPFGLADFLQHGLMPGAQRGDAVLESREFGLVALVELLVGELDLFQFALESGKRAFFTLIGEVRLFSLLFEALNVRLRLGEFSGPRFDLVPGCLIGLLRNTASLASRYATPSIQTACDGSDVAGRRGREYRAWRDCLHGTFLPGTYSASRCESVSRLRGAAVPEVNFSEKWKNGKIFRETCSALSGLRIREQRGLREEVRIRATGR